MLNPYAFDAKFAARIGALDNGFAKSSEATAVPPKPGDFSPRSPELPSSAFSSAPDYLKAYPPDEPSPDFRSLYKAGPTVQNGGKGRPSTAPAAPSAPLVSPPSLVGAAVPSSKPVGSGTVLASPPSSGEPVGTGTVLAPPSEVDTPQAGWLDRLGSIPPWQIAAGVGATGLGLYGLRQLMRGDDDEEKKKRSS